MAIYDVGQYRIPNPGLIIDGNQVPLPTSSPLITVYLPDEIQSMAQDSLAIAPIQTIIEEPLTLEDFKLPLIALGILLASIALIYFFRSRRKDPSIHHAPEVQDPAHVIARRQLYELKDKELWQKGEIKSYQSELTHIIREYIENRYDIRALEMTTYEILDVVPNEVDQNKLRNILQIADMVKFAKADPPVDIHARFMDQAFEIVEETKLEEKLTEEDA
jgi:ABC-type anion transport system duplicated permease subunit